MKKLAIIDYGSGNLHSARKAFEKANIDANLNYSITLTSSLSDVKNADKIVVPGVGAFADCVNGIKSVQGLVDEIRYKILENNAPFLGICVGMQMLADSGYENSAQGCKHEGLGFISGEVKKIKLPKLSTINHQLSTNLKLPHMGWNNLTELDESNPLLKGISEQDDFYFVHSYHFDAENNSDVTAKVDYGNKITAIINKENIWGVQFHPEKSQKTGIKLIENFLRV